MALTRHELETEPTTKMHSFSQVNVLLSSLRSLCHKFGETSSNLHQRIDCPRLFSCSSQVREFNAYEIRKRDCLQGLMNPPPCQLTWMVVSVLRAMFSFAIFTFASAFTSAGPAVKATFALIIGEQFFCETEMGAIAYSASISVFFALLRTFMLTKALNSPPSRNPEINESP